MIAKELISPGSIAVIGGSNDCSKPGGNVLKNLIDNNYTGKLYVVNRNGTNVRGQQTFKNISDLPPVECAILAIPAEMCVDAVRTLCSEKGCKAIIIFSAGFNETSQEGKEYEREIVEIANKYGASLIGPNCIGVITKDYAGVFTRPNNVSEDGVTIISASGATVVFIMEEAQKHSLKFANVFSVGNSAQIGIEEILEYLDENFTEKEEPQVIMLYIENISDIPSFVKSSRSLIKKGARIVAIKSGYSSAGSRAAMSHTGAISTPDTVVDALFRKCGIIRAYSREELVSIASVLKYKRPAGKRVAIVTHAGGPAIMLTDILSSSGMEIPHISGEKADRLLEKLYQGSSVSNPIDFLSTGTPEQLDAILNACTDDFDVDAVVVIFGSPGLRDVSPAYDVLLRHIKSSPKPIYPVLPSVINAEEAINRFQNNGGISFSDEVSFGAAFAKTVNNVEITEEDSHPAIDIKMVRDVIERAENGLLPPQLAQTLLDAAGIERAKEIVTQSVPEAMNAVREIGFPVAMKVIGPVHKSDIGGVSLNITDENTLEVEFSRMMKLPDVTGILIQPMLSGTEVFVGAKREGRFGTLVMCGIGGLFVEIIKDVQCALAPVSKREAEEMIKGLKCYKLIKGARGTEPVNEILFADVIRRVSALCSVAPEICELDLNPLLGNSKSITAIDARIRIMKH